MGGPMGFAVMTTTSSRDLRNGLAPHVATAAAATAGDETHNLTDDQTEYLKRMLTTAVTSYTLIAARGSLETALGGGVSEDKSIGFSDIQYFNRGMTSCVGSRGDVNVYAFRLAKMLCILGTVTDDQIVNKCKELNDGKTDRLDNLEKWLYFAMYEPFKFNRVVDVMYIIRVEFLRQFKVPTNKIMRGYCRAVSRRFSEEFTRKDGQASAYVIDRREHHLWTFLRACWARSYVLLYRKNDETYPNVYSTKEADARESAVRICSIETSLAVIRVLCVVPFDAEVAKAKTNDITSPTLLMANVHVVMGSDKSTTERSLLMTLLTHSSVSFFSPGIVRLSDFLMKDAKIFTSDYTFDRGNVALDTQKTQLHIFLFIVALMYQACEPYNDDPVEATDNMREFLLPFFRTIFDILAVLDETLRKMPSWLEQLKFNFAKTQFMRDRIAKALFETDNEDVGENYFISQLDGVLWASPE